MLSWALGFFFLAILAALFGFGGIAGLAVDVAVLLVIVFLALAALSLIFGGRVQA